MTKRHFPHGDPESPNTLDLTRPRWSQDTYLGRLKHFSAVTSPLNLLSSADTLQAAKSLVDSHIAGKVFPDVSVEAYWRAKILKDATYHPDTGEKVFLPFRMSAFVPVNIPIILGLLIPNPSIGTLIGWQLFNQSMNVAYNWANANKSIEMSAGETATAYVGAVLTSCTAAVGLTKMTNRGLIPCGIGPFIPFVSVASAGAANVFLMRQKEIREGIEVQDVTGNTVGKSQKAGVRAVGSVAISRVVASMPSLIIPPIIMGMLETRGIFSRHPRLRLPANLSLITGALLVGLPSAIALFPQRASVDVDKLEDRFAHIPDKENGGTLQTVYFNKGL